MDEAYLADDIFIDLLESIQHSWTNLLKVCNFTNAIVKQALENKMKVFILPKGSYSQKDLDERLALVKRDQLIKSAETGNTLLLATITSRYGKVKDLELPTRLAKIAALKDFSIYVKYLLKPIICQSIFPLTPYGSLQDTIYHIARANNNNELAEMTMTPTNDPWYHVFAYKWCKSLDKVCTDNQSQLPIQRLVNACESRCGACFYWNWGARGAIMACRAEPLRYMITIYNNKQAYRSRKYRNTGLEFDWQSLYLTAAEYGNAEIFNLIKQECSTRYILVDKKTALARAKFVNNTETISLI